jgi:hypothetical protein
MFGFPSCFPHRADQFTTDINILKTQDQFLSKSSDQQTRYYKSLGFLSKPKQRTHHVGPRGWLLRWRQSTAVLSLTCSLKYPKIGPRLTLKKKNQDIIILQPCIGQITVQTLIFPLETYIWDSQTVSNQICWNNYNNVQNQFYFMAVSL